MFRIDWFFLNSLLCLQLREKPCRRCQRVEYLNLGHFSYSSVWILAKVNVHQPMWFCFRHCFHLAVVHSKHSQAIVPLMWSSLAWTVMIKCVQLLTLSAFERTSAASCPFPVRWFFSPVVLPCYLLIRTGLFPSFHLFHHHMNSWRWNALWLKHECFISFSLFEKIKIKLFKKKNPP